MKRRRSFSLIVLAVFMAIVSYLISGFIFKSPTKNAKAPVVPAISQDFPDVATDPNYTSIFNDKALDPTQTVQIGGSNNNQPFTGQ